MAVGLYLAVTGPAAAQTLKTDYISTDLNYLPFFAAQKKGFHAKEIFRRECAKQGTEVMVKI